MKTYTVSWEIQIDAETPRKAAEEALRIHRNPESTAIVFDVFDEHGNKTTVDLLDDAKL